MKRLLRDLLARRGYVLQKAVSVEEIRSLIQRLHPKNTDYPLIRLGPQGDGGYLVPDCLEGIEACFSPGVDKVSVFEQDCLQRGMKVYMADHSVDRPNLHVPEDQYSFVKKFIGSINDEVFMTMDRWVEDSDVSTYSDLLLQMDIEGAEYESMINISDGLLARFRVMVFEFHRLQDLWDPSFFEVASLVFQKILRTHECVHIHPNNYSEVDSRAGVDIPRNAEFTFLRKDYCSGARFSDRFPHPLDYDCTTNPHIALPPTWYRQG